MSLRIHLPLVLILAVSSCRLWRQDPEPPVVHATDATEPDKVPAPSSGDTSAPDQKPLNPESPDTAQQTLLFDYLATRDKMDLTELRKRLHFRPISATTVISDFTKQAAPHPRILANRTDFDRLRTALEAQDPYVVASVEALRKKAENYLKAPILPYQLDAANLRLTPPHQTQDSIAVLSLLYQLTNNQAYATKVKDHLLNYAQFPDWNDAKHFLDTGIMSYTVALGYDWTFDQLTADERKLISTALMEKGLKRYLERSSQKAFWYQSKNNWNPICNGGISLAAMAIMDTSAEAKQLGAEVLAKALAGIPPYIREFEPDGQTVEGMMYWEYGLSNFIRWMETLKRSLGTDYGYPDTPGLKAAGTFPLAVSGPVTGISLGDDAIKKSRSETNFWFSKRYNLPSLARHHRNAIQQNSSYTWMDLFFYDPKLLTAASPPAQAMPLDRYVRDLEYVSFRSSWNHDEALYIGVHGGDNKASHGHLDAGTFFVQGAGKVWAVGGLGGDNYTFPGYFRPKTLPDYMSPEKIVVQPGRFHMYRLRAEGKNVLVFNPDVRPDQNPVGAAEVERILTQPGDAMALLNLSQVYERDAQKVYRGVALRENRLIVVIQDEIKMKAPSTVWWSMHTMASAELLQNGRVAILKQGDKRLWMEIQAPAQASFTIQYATYLPGLSFPLSKNSPNVFQGETARKLTIQLKQVTEQRITVSMKLVDINQDSPALPDSIPLADWPKAFAQP